MMSDKHRHLKTNRGNDGSSKCKIIYLHILGMPLSRSYKPLLEDKQNFPDSSFTASASSKGHSATNARVSSDSSWCAPVSTLSSSGLNIIFKWT